MAAYATKARSLLSRSSLGWAAAAAAFAVIAVLGAALARFDEFLLVFAPLAAAAVTNVLTLLSAVLVSQTRQFRPLWCTLVAGFCVYFVAASLHWSWARDLGLVGLIGLLVLGFPVSLGLIAILIVESKLQVTVAEVLGAGEGVLCLLVLPYFQHFVLLPKLFHRSHISP
jgi:hypothetical protein